MLTFTLMVVGLLVLAAYGGEVPPAPAGEIEAAAGPETPPMPVPPGSGQRIPPPAGPDLPVPPPATDPVVTFTAALPPDGKVALPGLEAIGKGEIELRVVGTVRFSGDGTVWVDPASSVTLDSLTSATRTTTADGIVYERFAGRARVVGKSVQLKAKGERLRAVVEGSGSVTLRGEGMFSLTDAKGRLVSGIWDAAGMTEKFSQVGRVGGPGGLKPLAARPGAAGVGLLPDKPPPVKVYEPTKLPSEGGSVPPAPGPGGPAPTPAVPVPSPTPSR
jgi:hypothetical protein